MGQEVHVNYVMILASLSSCSISMALCLGGPEAKHEGGLIFARRNAMVSRDVYSFNIDTAVFNSILSR